MPVLTERADTARTLLRDQAYTRLRDAILDGTLEPGEQLKDAELADWLGLSRTPIREAVAAAVAADDGFRGVLVQASANREIARSLARLMPKIRRLERARFGSLAGRRSVEQHERIVALSAAGEAEQAAAAVRENWLSLGALIDQSFGE